jgi:hypothetical protein
MRIVLAVLASLALLSCAHSTSEGASGRPKCPDSDKASMCSSGGLKCEVDEKRVCDLCKCEHVVF